MLLGNWGGSLSRSDGIWRTIRGGHEGDGTVTPIITSHAHGKRGGLGKNLFPTPDSQAAEQT